MPRRVPVFLAKDELWELINNFGQSFQAGGEGNELADRVMEKLHEAHAKFRKTK